MGGGMGGLRAGPVSGPATRRRSRSSTRVFDAAARRDRSDVPPDRQAGPVGPAGPPALREYLRHAAGDARRSLRRPPEQRRRPSSPGNESDASRSAASGGHAAARAIRLQRSGRAALRRARGRRLLDGRKLAVSFHVVGLDRADDVAREGAADLVCDARPGAAATAPKRPTRRFRSRRRPGISSTPSTCMAPPTPSSSPASATRSPTAPARR